jgi:hypothetical protein
MPGMISINRAKAVYETIEGEVIIMNVETGNYYSLLGTEAAIWSLLERRVSRRQLIDEMVRRYKASRREIESAVNTFLGELGSEQLIIIGKNAEAERQNPPDAICLPDGHFEKLSFDPPVLEKHTNMADLLLLDPIHEVDHEKGWPSREPT